MATGLNFQTQTIINSNFDPDSNKELFGIICQKSDEQEKVINVKAADEDTGGSIYGDKLGVKILRDFSLYKDKPNVGKVLSIRKAVGKEAVKCKAEINFAFDENKLLNTLKPTKGKNYCRFDVYLGVEGAEPYIYSTPWVQKGIPFWVEFTVSDSATAKSIADDLESLIKKNNVFQQGKDLIKITNDGSGKLTLTGTDEFQRFKKIEISLYDDVEDYAEKVAEITASGPIKVTARGENSFGTYSQIIKDLRLPTAANTQWTHIRQAETPIVGAIYDQYIVEYAAPATNGGMQSVGQRLDSHTTHVFWVKNDSSLIGNWEKALKVIDPDGGSLDNENVGKTIGERVSELESKP